MKPEELLSLKEEIEEAKTELAELKGQEKAILQTLKKDFNVSSIREAEAEVKALDKALKKLQKERDEIIDKIEKAYDFDE